ncbi:MAG TPA: hypothetical protein VMH06_02960 [Thermodesulfovibrionales bacterium]|nr:hypothetical protein [Thermodesulfovibrionales bacterium]
MGNRSSVRSHLLGAYRLVPVTLFLLACFLVLSCAPKRVEMPSFEGVTLEDELARRCAVQALTSTFSIEFEKDGGVVKGDAVLKLTPETLELRVYSLGFLVAEVTADETSTTSDPPIDRNRIALLVEGLRNSFFWWSIQNGEIREEDNIYRVRNSWRRVYISKKTFLPERQVIELEDGRELEVTYEEPDRISGVWFPSRLRIALSRYSVNLKIKTLSVTPP